MKARVWWLGLATAFASTAGADTVPWTLADAMDRSGFVHASTADGGYVVVFDAQATDAVEQWPVTVHEVGSGEWVLVFCTLIERDPERPFSRRLLEHALTYNGRAAGSKFAIDPDSGDLDVQYEIPTGGLSPDLVRRMVADVAATCDANRNTFEELARAESR